LLEIFPRLLARFPNLIWIIVGTGPLEQAIVQRARELQVASALRFIGAVPAERLRLFYAIADIFVLLTHKTAQSTEAWGTVFLEAAASGLAVVAGSGGGVDEAVLHKKTGLVVDTDHPHEVIDSILTLLERPEYAAELGSAGRERVVSQFLWSEQLSKIV
jgi:phosphatidylinositol alpha-1,6-mannosyltransferase